MQAQAATKLDFDVLTMTGIRPSMHSNVEYCSFVGHSDLLRISLRRAVPATLLYPLSGTLGHRAYARNVSDHDLNSVPNFERAYHTRRRVEDVNGDCQTGFQATAAVRYLHEVSELPAAKILEAVLDKTTRGKREVIESGNIDRDQLMHHLGLHRRDTHRSDEFEVSFPSNPLFDRVTVEWVGTNLRGDLVHVTLKEGAFMPPTNMPHGNVWVDARDTALASYLPEVVQERRLKDESFRRVIEWVPAHVLTIQKREVTLEGIEHTEQLPYPLHEAYYGINLDTRTFTFKTPNSLDAAMTAFWFVKALIPVVSNLF